MPRHPAILHSGSRLTRASRRARRSADIRARLFRAALDLFAKHGYLETTVEDITEAADVGKGTFINYIPTKEHVLASYGEERIKAIERALQEARKGERPVLSILGELAADLAGQSSESPALLRSIYAAHASCQPVRSELQKRMQHGRGLMSGRSTPSDKNEARFGAISPPPSWDVSHRLSSWVSP